MANPPEAIAYVGAGSNLGDRQTLLRRAIEALHTTAGCRVSRVSRWYESTALGPGNQPDYINAVIEVRSTLPPRELLDLLHRIERDNGRERSVRWAPRTLDLDLLLYGDRRIDSDELRLPHPGLSARNFVVYPLYDLAPDLVLPDGTPIATLRARLDANGLRAFADEPESMGA